MMSFAGCIFGIIKPLASTIVSSSDCVKEGLNDDYHDPLITSAMFLAL